MRDLKRLNAELHLLERKYGVNGLEWANDCSWIHIFNFQLPRKYNKSHSEVLVFVPENYGHAMGYRDAFLSPGLKLQTASGLKPLDSKQHYFDKYPYANALANEAEVLKKKGWAYLCLHQSNQRATTINVMVFLEQLYTFLSNPEKHSF